MCHVTMSRINPAYDGELCGMKPQRRTSGGIVLSREVNNVAEELPREKKAHIECRQEFGFCSGKWSRW